jgi:hypothetical protein
MEIATKVRYNTGRLITFFELMGSGRLEPVENEGSVAIRRGAAAWFRVID